VPARVLVVGLDCLAPDLVFERWRDRLPTFARLMDEGVFGPLRSTDPPITVPAWASMLSGRDPGELGLYGFRNRRGHDYGPPAIATGSSVRHPRIWDLAGAAGLESLVVGVPPTWPPKPLRGRLVTDFLTPGTDGPFTFPEDLAARVDDDAGGPYLLDAVGFRGADPAALVDEVTTMTERRFRLFGTWLRERAWDFAMVMEIGVDRIHHGLWHHMDADHVHYPGPGSPFEDAIRDYYVRLDGWLSETMAAAGEGAHVLVVSDHGAQSMAGGVHLNAWLRQEGYLTVTAGPDGEAPDRIPPGTPLSRCRIDWRRTRAWADGGYCGRIYLNVAGREPEGSVPADAYEATRDALIAGFSALEGFDGRPLAGTAVHRPESLYRTVTGIAPDLMVYLGDLKWRALGTVGGDWPVLSKVNDTGPDGANHAMDGVFILREGGGAPAPGGRLEDLRIYDVFPTVLGLLGVPIPEGTLGESRIRTSLV
jgi:predicted AlkP superfamily phosphohydrolase/phosphomutase